MTLRVAGFKVLALYIPLYYVGAQVIDPRHDLPRIFRLTILLALISGLSGLYQFLNGPTSFEWAWLRSGFTSAYSEQTGIGDSYFHGVFRPFSTFASSDGFGFYSMNAILLTLYFVLGVRNRMVCLLFCISGFVLFGFSLVTATRSAWVGILVACALIFVLKSSHHKVRNTMLTGVGMAFLVDHIPVI